MISDPQRIPWSQTSPGVMAELITADGDRVRLYAHYRADGLAQWLARNRMSGETRKGVGFDMLRAVADAGHHAIETWGEIRNDPDRFDELMARAHSVTP